MTPILWCLIGGKRHRGGSEVRVDEKCEMLLIWRPMQECIEGVGWRGGVVLEIETSSRCFIRLWVAEACEFRESGDGTWESQSKWVTNLIESLVWHIWANDVVPGITLQWHDCLYYSHGSYICLAHKNPETRNNPDVDVIAFCRREKDHFLVA